MARGDGTSILVREIIYNYILIDVDTFDSIKEYFREFLKLGLGIAMIENAILKLIKQRYIKNISETTIARYVVNGETPSDIRSLEVLEKELYEKLNQKKVIKAEKHIAESKTKFKVITDDNPPIGTISKEESIVFTKAIEENISKPKKEISTKLMIKILGEVALEIDTTGNIRVSNEAEKFDIYIE